MITKPLSELPEPGTYSQSFNGPEYLKNGSTVVYGSGCFFGTNFILTTTFRDDLTGHDDSDPTHLNIQRKFERILRTGSEWIAKEENISDLNETFWLPHRISWSER